MAKNKTTTPANEPERFDVLGARTYVTNKETGETRTDWFQVGRAFPNSKGGFNLRLWAVPAATDGEVFLMIAKAEPKGED